MRSLANASRLGDGVSPPAWSFFVALYAAAARCDGRFVESYRAIAAATGAASSTVPRFLRELAAHGLIEYESLSASEFAVTVL